MKSVSKEDLIRIQKENEAHIKMLQSIINADTHILAVTDLETVSFANKTFLNFFNVDDVAKFNDKHDSFLDIFLEQEDHLHKGLVEKNEDFMELFLETEIIKRNVMIFNFNTFAPTAFQFNITPINRIENKDIYLVTFIDISMMTLENVKMKNKVYIDNLTGVYNRNKIDEVFEDTIIKAQRYDEVFSLILIDIDHFKNFNDTYGHLIGDEILVSLAQTISKITRDTDTFARWGGEEFVIVLPNTAKENAAIVAEYLRNNIAKIQHETAGGITASFGIAQYENGDTEKSMYEKCDKALYTAKENGRNRVEIG